jgi:hypothetical protein
MFRIERTVASSSGMDVKRGFGTFSCAGATTSTGLFRFHKEVKDFDRNFTGVDIWSSSDWEAKSGKTRFAFRLKIISFLPIFRHLLAF